MSPHLPSKQILKRWEGSERFDSSMWVQILKVRKKQISLRCVIWKLWNKCWVSLTQRLCFHKQPYTDNCSCLDCGWYTAFEMYNTFSFISYSLIRIKLGMLKGNTMCGDHIKTHQLRIVSWDGLALDWKSKEVGSLPTHSTNYFEKWKHCHNIRGWFTWLTSSK